MGEGKIRLAIFASGTGTNAAKLIEHFRGHSTIEVATILSNKSEAGVLQIAADNKITTHVFNRDDFSNLDRVVQYLQENNIDWIILAGFLWKIPDELISLYPNKIINIHPALLPKFGGKGMYGMNVHRAVVEAGEEQSGITIHYVNENYDEGATIFQATCQVSPNDSPETVAQNVLQLEHEYFPRVVEETVLSLRC